jgi:hypothetical protein
MNKKPLLSALLALSLLCACKGTTTIVENNVGSFHGNVALVSAIGDTLSNYAGTTIQIQGTAFQATSIANGDWQIDNVPAGIYNILMTKPGFDTLIIPQYQFSGAGTSFLVGNAIQALPMDSLVFSLTNTIENNYGDSGYLALLTITGKLAGPDSLVQAQFNIKFGAADSGGSDINTYIVNGQIPAGISRGYTVGNVANAYKSGTVVSVWSLVWGRFPNSFASYAHFQQAVSPYSVKRTFILP